MADKRMRSADDERAPERKTDLEVQADEAHKALRRLRREPTTGWPRSGLRDAAWNVRTALGSVSRNHLSL